MTYLRFVAVLASAAAGTAARKETRVSDEPPVDWMAGIAAQNLLYAAPPQPTKLLPSIGNGFIAGDVGVFACVRVCACACDTWCACFSGTSISMRALRPACSSVLLCPVDVCAIVC